MRYFMNLVSRVSSADNHKKVEQFSSQFPRAGYNSRGYTFLNQQEQKFTSISGDSSSDEDLFSQQEKQMVTKGNYNMRQEFEKSYE